MTTDTPKRLSDVEMEDIRQWTAHKDDMAVGPDFRTGMSFAAKLLSHIAALTAPPSQGKVERAREIAVDIVAKNMIRGEAAGPAYVVKLCIAAQSASPQPDRESEREDLEGMLDAVAEVRDALNGPLSSSDKSAALTKLNDVLRVGAALSLTSSNRPQATEEGK